MATRKDATTKLAVQVILSNDGEKEKYGQRVFMHINPELSDEDVRRVAVGAIKYSDFIADRKTGILYDPNKIFALTGQSGPFCQYACVRMRRILEKNADFAGADFADYDFADE